LINKFPFFSEKSYKTKNFYFLGRELKAASEDHLAVVKNERKCRGFQFISGTKAPQGAIPSTHKGTLMNN